MFLNRQPIQPAGVVEAIKALQPADQRLVLVLNADRSINYGEAIAVLDQVRQVPGVKVTIATTKLLP